MCIDVTFINSKLVEGCFPSTSYRLFIIYYLSMNH